MENTGKVDFCGTEEAVKLLEAYGLKERANNEYKGAVSSPPLDIMKRNEIWCDLLDEPRLKMKQQLEGRAKVHCEKLKKECYHNYVFPDNKSICDKCEDYQNIVKLTIDKMNWISKVQEQLRLEGAEDETRR